MASTHVKSKHNLNVDELTADSINADNYIGPDERKGTWNASTNTPTLVDGTGDDGDYYLVSVGGTQDLGSGSLTYTAADRVLYAGSAWTKVDTASTAVEVPIEDAGSLISGTNVETALQEHRPLINSNTTHSSSSGSDHADVVANTLELASAVTDTGAGAGNAGLLVELDGSGLLDGRDIANDGADTDSNSAVRHARQHGIATGADHTSDTLTNLSGMVSDDTLAGLTSTQTLSNKEVADLLFTLTGPARTPSEGMAYWDSDSKTLAVKLEGTDPVLQVGQEAHVRCTNKTGGVISDGTVVYINGAQGNNPTIAKARADADGTADAIGVTTQDIADNATGYVTFFGIVRGIDTSHGATWSDGDTIYLDASTAGDMTNSAPAFPNYDVRIGRVLYAHSTEGKLLVLHGVEPTNHSMFNHLGAKDLQVGDIGSGNYSEIESDGTMKMNGDATVYEDLQVGISNIRLPPSGAAAWGVWDFGLGGPDFAVLEMDIGEKIMFDFQTSHTMQLNTILDNHIHATIPTDDIGKKVNWQLDVIVAAIGENFYKPTGSPYTKENTFAGGEAGRHNMMDIADIPAFNSTISSIGKCILTRIAASSDDYGSPVYLLFTDCHYKKDTVGSREELVK